MSQMILSQSMSKVKETLSIKICFSSNWVKEKGCPHGYYGCVGQA